MKKKALVPRVFFSMPHAFSIPNACKRTPSWSPKSHGQHEQIHPARICSAQHRCNCAPVIYGSTTLHVILLPPFLMAMACGTTAPIWRTAVNRSSDVMNFLRLSREVRMRCCSMARALRLVTLFFNADDLPSSFVDLLLVRAGGWTSISCSPHLSPSCPSTRCS